MKLQIWYSHDGETRLGFWAKARIGPEYFCACANSWEEAREDLLQKVRTFLNKPVAPEPEEVEI